MLRGKSVGVTSPVPETFWKRETAGNASETFLENRKRFTSFGNSFLGESVFAHNNLRLLSRNTDQYLDEKTKMWDVGGDEFGTMEDTGYLRFAELSLDWRRAL
ncbi:hypothetical protein Tco_0806888 [Tanacetum coccineum]